MRRTSSGIPNSRPKTTYKKGPVRAGPLKLIESEKETLPGQPALGLSNACPEQSRRCQSYSAAISSASPSWRISSSSRSAASISAVTSCCTRAAASSNSGESWTLR